MIPKFTPLPKGYIDGGIRAAVEDRCKALGRVGPGSQYLTPHMSYCLHCGTTWVFVRGHSTPYSESSGCFPLCEECWGEMTPAQRLPYYHEMYEAWNDPSYAHWADIERAVLAGK